MCVFICLCSVEDDSLNSVIWSDEIMSFPLSAHIESCMLHMNTISLVQKSIQDFPISISSNTSSKDDQLNSVAQIHIFECIKGNR